MPLVRPPRQTPTKGQGLAQEKAPHACPGATSGLHWAGRGSWKGRAGQGRAGQAPGSLAQDQLGWKGGEGHARGLFPAAPACPSFHAVQA